MVDDLIISRGLHYAMTECANVSSLHHFTCTATVYVCTSIVRLCVCVCVSICGCVGHIIISIQAQGECLKDVSIDTGPSAWP